VPTVRENHKDVLREHARSSRSRLVGGRSQVTPSVHGGGREVFFLPRGRLLFVVVVVGIQARKPNNVANVLQRQTWNNWLPFACNLHLDRRTIQNHKLITRLEMVKKAYYLVEWDNRAIILGRFSQAFRETSPEMSRACLVDPGTSLRLVYILAT
jgi:hypothetical protein